MIVLYILYKLLNIVVTAKRKILTELNIEEDISHSKYPSLLKISGRIPATFRAQSIMLLFYLQVV